MGEGGREGGRYEEKRSGETGELPRRAQIRARMLGRRWKDETREKQIARRPYGYRTLRTSDLRMTRLYLPLSLSLSLFTLGSYISRLSLYVWPRWEDAIAAVDESVDTGKAETRAISEKRESEPS